MKAQEEKDRMSEQRMMAKMGGAAKSTGWDATDRDFAKTYEDWNAQGGYSTADRSVNAIYDAIQKLEKNPTLTGTRQQITPDFIRKSIYPESVANQQQVEQAVMGSLRATLGPQFTENEGKRILNLAYDPSLPSKYNITKLKALADEQKAKVEAKNAASQYFKENGTLRGFVPATASAQPSASQTSSIMSFEDFKKANGLTE
jgi:plasmid stabilization system protein ParE